MLSMFGSKCGRDIEIYNFNSIFATVYFIRCFLSCPFRRNVQACGVFHPSPSQHGPRLNKNTVFPRYGDSHVKNKTVFNVLSQKTEYIIRAPALRHQGYSTWCSHEDTTIIYI